MARMMVGRAPENVDGVWVDCVAGVRVQLRPIVPTKDQEIDFRHPTGTMRVNPKDGTEEFDPQKHAKRINAVFLEKGLYALMDTDGFEVQAADDDWRAFLSKVTATEVARDASVKIDGLWSEEVKRKVLASVENEGAICPFVVEIDEEIDGRPTGRKLPKTLHLTFDVWVVRMAQKLGRDSAARAAALKS